jgi:uncharacterized protein YdeI (YjbR/CyaY-like superfamily)
MLPQTLTFKSAHEWERWLANNYDLPQGVMLRIAKKASGISTVTYHEALDIALCYGWIDGIRRSLDANYFLQRFTPRRQRSLWSQVNVAKVEALIAAGRMQAPGIAEVERAKADGRWDAAYEPASKAQPPADLIAFLNANPEAKSFYEALNKANKYAIIWHLASARRPETKAKRFEKIKNMLKAGRISL